MSSTSPSALDTGGRTKSGSLAVCSPINRQMINQNNNYPASPRIHLTVVPPVKTASWVTGGREQGCLPALHKYLPEGPGGEGPLAMGNGGHHSQYLDLEWALASVYIQWAQNGFTRRLVSHCAPER